MTTPRILVAGGINRDEHLVADHEPADDGTARVREYLRAPGGHAGNCAGALAALGMRPAVLGAVGGDAAGREALEDLRRAGVDVDTVRISLLPTGRVFLPHLGARRYMLMYRGANDDPALALALADALRGTRFDYMVLLDPPLDALAVLAERPRAGPRVCWNPGGLLVREAGFAALARNCDTLVMNEGEFALAFGGAPDAGAYARVFGAREDARLVVTRGARGCLLFGPRGRRAFPAHPVEAADTTGAGDAFTAAYAAFDAAGAPAARALRAANAAGALATRRLGARASLATMPELLDALKDGAHPAPRAA